MKETNETPVWLWPIVVVIASLCVLIIWCYTGAAFYKVLLFFVAFGLLSVLTELSGTEPNKGRNIANCVFVICAFISVIITLNVAYSTVMRFLREAMSGRYEYWVVLAVLTYTTMVLFKMSEKKWTEWKRKDHEEHPFRMEE